MIWLSNSQSHTQHHKTYALHHANNIRCPTNTLEFSVVTRSLGCPLQLCSQTGSLICTHLWKFTMSVSTTTGSQPQPTGDNNKQNGSRIFCVHVQLCLRGISLEIQNQRTRLHQIHNCVCSHSLPASVFATNTRQYLPVNQTQVKLGS